MNSDNEPISTDDAVADAMRDALNRSVASEPPTSITWTTVLSRARRVVVLRRVLAAGACVVVVVGVAAIAFAATSENHRRGVSVIGSTTTTTTTTTPECTHRPIASDASYAGMPTPDGPSIDFVHVAGLIDSRGNRVDTEGLSVRRTGPDGTVTLTLGDNAAVALRGFGDFDGDGRGDLLVDAIGDYTSYIVPGTVAAGTYDPAAVGIRIPNPAQPGENAWWPESVGDQDRDGADDVSFGRRLYSGRELATLPAGAALPAPFRTLPSEPVGLVRLDENGPPSFVVLAPFGFEVLADHLDHRLLLEPATFELSPGILRKNEGSTRGWVVNGHHLVQFDWGTRSGVYQWRWDLDAACDT
jgi:hypothetical protein